VTFTATFTVGINTTFTDATFIAPIDATFITTISALVNAIVIATGIAL
jgi:hypothetical protein